MAKKKSYSVKSSEFHDYFEGKLSKRERNAFERKMQQDLFNMDAAEGFAMVSREEAEEDLAMAGKQIRRRINLRKRIGWYSAAASLAAILAITTIFLTVDPHPDSQENRIREMNEALENTIPHEPSLKKAEEQGMMPLDKNAEASDEVEKDAAAATPGETISETDVDERIVSADAVTEAVAEDEVRTKARAVDAAEMAFDQPGAGAATPGEDLSDKNVADAQALIFEEGDAEEAEVILDLSDQDMHAGEAVKKTEAAIPVLAEQEAPVSAEKSARSAKGKSAPALAGELEVISVAADKMDSPGPPAIAQAEPVNGMTSYMQYIDSTLVFPGAEYNRNTAVVDLKFYVLPNGRPYNIQVVSSPAKAFSDEAHRVVTNGPDWIPARQAGEYVDSELELRVAFTEQHKQ